MSRQPIIIPTYLPTITTMAVLVQAETPVFEIQENYQKQSYRNRTYINTANGRLGLTIPVKHTRSGKHKKTAEVMIENNFLWQRQHWRSIQIAYRSSPFFEFYEDDLASLYKSEYERLLDYNLKGIRLLLELLGISKSFEMTKNYEKNTEYTDFRLLTNAKKNPEIKIPEYDQVFADINKFNAQVSVIDLLFNQGPDSLNYLQNLSLKPINLSF